MQVQQEEHGNACTMPWLVDWPHLVSPSLVAGVAGWEGLLGDRRGLIELGLRLSSVIAQATVWIDQI